MKNSAALQAEQLYRDIFETANDGILVTDLETGGILAANPTAAAMHGYTPQAFLNLQLLACVHASSQPDFDRYTELIKQGKWFDTLAEHVRQDGSHFSVEWRAVPFTHQGRTCSLALLRDVSKRVQAESRLQHQAELQASEQASLLVISQTLASELDLHPELILDQLGVLIKYTCASLFTIEDSTLVALAVRGSEPLQNSMPFSIRLDGEESLQALFNGQHPIRIADVWNDEPAAEFLRTLLENGAAVMLEGVHSWMWVPLIFKGRLFGGIGVAHIECNYFTPHLADLAMTIANQAVVALVNAELYEHAQELAALQERQRLARNLHDAVNQSLFSAGLIAEVLPNLWEKNPVQARRSLKDLRRLTRGALAEMRSMLAELRPSTLIDTELGELLHQLSNAFTGRTSIPIEVTVHGEGSLPAEVQVAVYRICQEGLSNITKHARASQVRLNLRLSPEGLELQLDDNGRGFVSPELTPSGHYGLSMMRERAAAVGAVLTVNSKPGQGTEILLHWDRQEEV
ncbi:MAG: PAS domain S-box protein [Anaerolineales bacterium]|nr:PAS domain S-box protein [Anaerolineales bacterium]